MLGNGRVWSNPRQLNPKAFALYHVWTTWLFWILLSKRLCVCVCVCVCVCERERERERKKELNILPFVWMGNIFTWHNNQNSITRLQWKRSVLFLDIPIPLVPMASPAPWPPSPYSLQQACTLFAMLFPSPGVLKSLVGRESLPSLMRF